MTKAVLILANPNAKRGAQRVRRVVQKLSAAHEALGWQVVSRQTERTGPRECEIVAAHAEQVQTIVAVGGDGTVRETVLGMTDGQRDRIDVGLVPMGNANVLAREVGIAWDDEDLAIQQAMQGHTTRMDVGAINDTPTFLLMLDVGYFAEVVQTIAGLREHRATRWLYSLGGDALYGCVGLWKWLLPNRADVQVVADQHPPFTATSIAIANAATYAKTGAFCPAASASDGVLDFNAARPGKTMRYSLAAVRGKPNAAASIVGSARQFTLIARQKRFVCQVDGDPLPDGPFAQMNVTVLPGYYSLITPESPHRRHQRAVPEPKN